MSATEKIELVCFDLGGVLVRIRTGWSDLCRATDLDVRGDSGGHAAQHARQQLGDRLQAGDLSTEQWLGAMQKALGGLYTAKEITVLLDAVLADEYPGVGALIDELHGAGVATACLSNTNDVHWPKLVHRDGEKPLPGEPRYPAVQRLGSHHASHLMRLAKPSLAVYRAFEKATGYSGPHILFFDDLPAHVAAARKVGWRAELIDPARPPDEQLRRHLRAHGAL